MQYEVGLPADYDMRILRERVAGAHHVTDDRAGLGLKAYVIRERGVDGSPVNEYAPFYLWHDTRAMARFLFDGRDGFERIISSFGRAAVSHWTGVAVIAGPARAAPVVSAARRLSPIPSSFSIGDEVDDNGRGLSRFLDAEIEALHRYANVADVHTAALVVDPRSWQLVRFVLWANTIPADEDATERYQVLHVSSPGLRALPSGRAW